MESDYERRLFDHEEHHWWYRGRRRVVAALLGRARVPAGAEILDVGCGTGRNLVELAGFGHARGAEPSEAAARVGRERGLDIVATSVEDLPFPDAAFDLVTALDVIEHTDDDVVALREIRRVVRPGGACVVTVPAYPRLWGPHDVINLHRRRYTRRMLREAAGAAGWRVELTTSFNLCLLAPAAALRILSRNREPARGGRSDFDRTPRSLNPVLELPIRLEAAAIRAGVRVPAGLSLCAVLRAPA